MSDEHFRDLSFQMDYPLISPRLAMLNIVRRCNAQCQYCVDWKNDPNPNTDPPASEIMRIIDELVEIGVKVVMFTGGEPLLRKDIFDLMGYAVEKGLEVSIITNGTALTEEKIHALARLQAYKVGVSIDSLDQSRMLQIRGLKIAQVLKAIRLLAELKGTIYPALNVVMYVTVTRINIRDLLPMLEFAKDNGITIQYQPVQFSGSGTTDEVLENLWPKGEEIEELETIFDILIAKKFEGYPINNRAEFLAQIPIFFRNKTFYPGDQCTVAYTDVVIDTEFGLRPCWPMEPIAYLNDGKSSIRDLWFSEDMKQVRKLIREKKCPGCLYACHLNKSYTPLPSL